MSPISWEIREFLEDGALDSHYAVSTDDFAQLMTRLSDPDEE